MSYVIGIDLGTGSLKGIVVNREGEILESSSKEYSIIQKRRGYSEQNPIDWIEALKFVLIELRKKVPQFDEFVEGISFSGQMHSLVLLDELENILRPAILWNDTRNHDEVNQIMTESKNELLDMTYNRALEGFTLPKLMWVKNNEPEIYSKISSVMLPKDYLAYYLTGIKTMDYSDASGTLLLNMREKQWSHTICKKYDVNEEWLPKLVSTGEFIGTINTEIAKDLGLKNNIKVFAGAADNACGAFGAGVIDGEKDLLSIGTSGVYLSNSGYPRKNDGTSHVFYNVSGGIYQMGVTLSAGQSLSWFKNVVAPEDTFEDFVNGVSEIPAGADGLIFTPYIMGERTPHFDSEIRGTFANMDSKMGLNHFVRAVMEGIVFSLKDCRNVVTNDNTPLVSIGGGAKNQDWLQIQADILNVEINTLSQEEGPALGAAMIAMMGLEWYPTWENCANSIVKIDKTFKPIQENVLLYEKLYNEYRKIYLFKTH